MKIGIYGGSFNPPHLGHVNAVQSVYRKMGLDRIIIVPTLMNPLKKLPSFSLASPDHRLKMAQLAFENLGPSFSVDDVEIKRGGISYTIDTLRDLRKKWGSEHEFFLIIGVDNLSNFDQWRLWEKILEEVDLVITSRPGWSLPQSIDELPESIRPLVRDFQFNQVFLHSGRKIYFISLRDVNISSTEIRRSFQMGKKHSADLPLEVERYIVENGLYPPLYEKVKNDEELCREVAVWMDERKASNIRIFDLRGQEAICDFVVIASGSSTKHSSAIAEFVQQRIKEKYNVLPGGIEGMQEGNWVILDYGSLVIHVFFDYVRRVYSLEELLKGAKEISLLKAQ
ncbi:MAG: nicotinate (nicotinamide) nucleotide adenylyltransferase [Bdellovibrionaceae bacterium]|nr:nicotinate (nicotinamide) nucleotide adenylyltransferase [Pseudobdellovibrionaceae bacterium]MDW8191181.1 nicotinate (nicotinamide) nucleotide adenylyltransferase [Pseudobdellovibrionaceae bacterium]